MWGGNGPVTIWRVPLPTFKSNTKRIVRIFRIKEIVIGSEYIFPLREVADRISRTIGPHGEPTQVHLPGRGAAGTVNLYNRVPTRTQEINESVKSKKEKTNRVVDHGAGERSRYKNTLRPVGETVAEWKDKNPLVKDKILAEATKVSV